MVELLRTHLSEKHSFRLEWGIIALIAVEVWSSQFVGPENITLYLFQRWSLEILKERGLSTTKVWKLNWKFQGSRVQFFKPNNHPWCRCGYFLELHNCITQSFENNPLIKRPFWAPWIQQHLKSFVCIAGLYRSKRKINFKSPLVHRTTIIENLVVRDPKVLVQKDLFKLYLEIKSIQHVAFDVF